MRNQGVAMIDQHTAPLGRPRPHPAVSPPTSRISTPHAKLGSRKPDGVNPGLHRVHQGRVKKDQLSTPSELAHDLSNKNDPVTVLQFTGVRPLIFNFNSSGTYNLTAYIKGDEGKQLDGTKAQYAQWGYLEGQYDEREGFDALIDGDDRNMHRNPVRELVATGRLDVQGDVDVGDETGESGEVGDH